MAIEGSFVNGKKHGIFNFFTGGGICRVDLTQYHGGTFIKIKFITNTSCIPPHQTVKSGLITSIIYYNCNITRSMCRIIALFNQSGGVGKSSLTMNLGYHLAKKKNRVLLIDMDPQASLTTFMGLEPENITQTIYEAVVGEEDLPVHPELIHGMSFTPANINLSAAELELVAALMRELRLKNALAPILDNYDYILIDCPPSLGILSVVSLVAATHVLVPIQCQFKSFQGTDLLLKTVASLRKGANRSLAIAGFIPTMYDARTAQESRTYEAIKEQLSPLAKVFDPIPKTIAFADASEARLPLALSNPKHPAIKVMKKIAASLEKIT